MPGSSQRLNTLLDGADLPSRRSLSADVLDRLRTILVRRAFAPGERLSESRLAAQFGVSRGPIREAFVELEREGLLTLERHRGARVTRLSQTDIDEIYELRAALERLAVERAVRCATDDDFAEMGATLAQLQRAVEAGDLHGVVALDVRFHDSIYRAAHHSRLYLNWSNLRPQIETFLHARSTDAPDYLEKASREHAELFAVLQTRSAPDADALISSHIRGAYERLSQISS